MLVPPPAAAAAGEVEEDTALATDSVEGEDGREALEAARRRESVTNRPCRLIVSAWRQYG